MLDNWRRDAKRGLHLQQLGEDAEVEVYSGVGADLRGARERRGLSLSDVARDLRIQQSHLEAIEEGRPQDLPGPTYAIGFLRSYSRLLGLDGERTVRQFKEEASVTPRNTKLVFPEPVEEARRPGLTVALVSLVLAGAIYGSWLFLEEQGRLRLEAVPEPPPRFDRLLAEKPAVETPASDTTSQIGATQSATQAVEAGAGDTPGEAAVAESTAAETAAPPSGQAIAAAESEETAPTVATSTVTKSTVTVQAPSATGAPSAESAAATTPAHESDPNARIAEFSGATPDGGAGDQGEGERAAAAEIAPRPATEETPPGNRETLNNAAAPVGAATTGSERPAADPPPTVTAEPSTAAIPSELATSIELFDNPGEGEREAEEVDTAPRMPSIQTAVAPPAPPAAPAAPTPTTQAEADDDGGRAEVTTAMNEPSGYRPQYYGATNQAARVVVRARADSWVQVQGANKELLLTRMLRAGDTYHAPNREDLVLMTGNAGAIEIIVDGEALGTLGPVGEVRRDVRLFAEMIKDQIQQNKSAGP
ncbi:MAG: DUF4115 domain-containing protein [Alphaproteobacteria bacterium]|nr:DUF4115 domain-containing protein [Alphaproteobacteria bacterium]